MSIISTLILAMIYPTIILGLFTLVFTNKKYNKVIKENWKSILINSILFFVIIAVGIVVFFSIEDTIYSYDYAGHWQRAISLQENYTSLKDVFLKVYDSMLYDDYSYLPAMFQHIFMFVSKSHKLFALSSLAYFLMPSIILLQVLYFSITNKYKYLPLFIAIIFFPLYLDIFYLKVDSSGLIFLLIGYLLIINTRFDKIRMIDNVVFNLCAFMMIFLRRWYLYPLIGFYLAYFIKYLFYYNFKILNKKALIDLFKIVSSGLLLLLIIVVFFNPYLINILTSTNAEAYSFYDNANKLLALLNYYGYFIITLVMIGIYVLVKNKKYEMLVVILVSGIIPYILLTQVQSLEYHHYFIININILVLLIIGLYFILEYKKIIFYIISSILMIQVLLMFSTDIKVPTLTTVKRLPVVLENKYEIYDVASYLNSIMGEWDTAYFATGNAGFNDDLIRNVSLPILTDINIESSVLDLRDGFPSNFEHIRYIVITDPILYLGDASHQRVYDIINKAILEEELFEGYYNLIFETKVNNATVYVYEKTQELTQEHLQYFYDEVIKIYPNNQELFANIIN